MALGLTAESTGIHPPSTGFGIWGSVTDLGFGKGGATVIALADGTASIYFSTGGGVIGGQGHAQLREAAVALVNSLEAHGAELRPQPSGELPRAGRVRFYAHARTGLLASDECEQRALASAHHPLAAVFRTLNRLLTQFRLLSADGAYDVPEAGGPL
jgi:hypothetical protein